ncbi:hypothetical protein Tco_1027862, partial [Tanacetum coccineum]
MTSQLCMVSLTGGFKDNDSTLTDSHLKETAEQNLVIRQRVEDFQLGIESYQTQLNLTKPRWEATGFEFKHDFTLHSHRLSEGSYIQRQIRGSDDHEEQGLHVRYLETAKDTSYLSESGEPYGWTDPRRRLP